MQLRAGNVKEYLNLGTSYYIGKMSKASVDSHGRIYIPKELRERHGQEFRIVEFKGELRLIPVPEDPVEDLRERTRSIRESDKSIEQLKEEAREELEKAAGE